MQKKHHREDILAAGERLFRLNGYHATGLNDILQTAGITKGTFYHYFTNKENFAREVVEYYGSTVNDTFRFFLDRTELQPLDRLRRLYEELTAQHKRENFRAGCLVGNFSLELAGQNTALASILDRQFLTWTDQLTPVIAEAQRSGVIANPEAPYELAHLLHQNYLGALSRSKASGTAFPLEIFYRFTFEYLFL